MSYIDEMNKTVKDFMDHLNSMLENDPDIEANSINDIVKKFNKEYNDL